jgi:hypothetical protein
MWTSVPKKEGLVTSGIASGYVPTRENCGTVSSTPLLSPCPYLAPQFSAKFIRVLLNLNQILVFPT